MTNPDPAFARMLQQAIGGVEGEIRVCMQYFLQAWGNRAPTTKYRDMLLHTATEEIGHIDEPIMGPARPDRGAQTQQIG